MPENAFVGGWEENGNPIYIGRVQFNRDDVLIGKVPFDCKYISYPFMQECTSNTFEVLTHSSTSWCLKWVRTARTGALPTGAIRGGSENVNVLFIGRARHGPTVDKLGANIVGKVNFGHNGLYFTSKGAELSCTDFEILVRTPIPHAVASIGLPNNDESMPPWIPASKGVIPEDAVVGGWGKNDDVHYVGRYRGGQFLIPGTVDLSTGELRYPFWYRERRSAEYEILVNKDKRWHLYWVRTCSKLIPPGALPGCFEKNDKNPKQDLYIGRKYHDGCLIVGKVHPEVGRIYFPHQDVEVSDNVYEILVCKELGYVPNPEDEIVI